MITTSQKTDLIIQTTRGAVRGTQEDGIGVFRGLPFAEPPVGKLCFRPPVPHRRWDGVGNAIRFGEIVPQRDESPFDKIIRPDVPQCDDCLNLNVWTPDPGQAALPGENPPQSLATTMHGAWTNFVKTGSPHQPSLPEWPVYEPSRRATMKFDIQSRVVDDPDGDERQLWDAAQF